MEERGVSLSRSPGYALGTPVQPISKSDTDNCTKDTKYMQSWLKKALNQHVHTNINAKLDRFHPSLHRVSKNWAKLFLSELRQISTNFDNVWQKDGKEAEIMRGVLIFHLT